MNGHVADLLSDERVVRAMRLPHEHVSPVRSKVLKLVKYFRPLQDSVLQVRWYEVLILQLRVQGHHFATHGHVMTLQKDETVVRATSHQILDHDLQM